MLSVWLSQFPSVFGTDFWTDHLRDLQTVKIRMRPWKRSGFIEAPASETQQPIHPLTGEGQEEGVGKRQQGMEPLVNAA